MFPGYTLGDLATQALQRADFENSLFVSTAEAYAAINKAAEKLIEKIASLSPDLLLKKSTITTVPGTAEYELATDVLKLHKISLRYTQGQTYDIPLTRRSTDAIETTQRQAWGYSFVPTYRARIATNQAGTAMVWMLDFQPPPDGVYTLPYEYVWGWTAKASSGDKIELPFPEYLVLDAAITFRMKEESDASELVQEREILERRIEAWLEPKDHFRGQHILDVRDLDDWGYP